MAPLMCLLLELLSEDLGKVFPELRETTTDTELAHVSAENMNNGSCVMCIAGESQNSLTSYLEWKSCRAARRYPTCTALLGASSSMAMNV